MNLYLATGILIFGGWYRPLEDPTSNTIEFINETLVLTNCYFLVLYTEFVPDVYMRYTLGWWNIGLIMLMILVNVITIGSNNLYNLYRKYKLYKLRKAYMKNVAERAARKAF